MHVPESFSRPWRKFVRLVKIGLTVAVVGFIFYVDEPYEAAHRTVKVFWDAVETYSASQSPRLNQASKSSHRTYVLESGEYPYKVALRYGVDYQTLLAVNNLSPEDVVHPGHRLIIPNSY
jgi:LysM repeat protein